VFVLSVDHDQLHDGHSGNLLLGELVHRKDSILLQKCDLLLGEDHIRRKQALLPQKVDLGLRQRHLLPLGQQDNLLLIELLLWEDLRNVLKALLELAASTDDDEDEADSVLAPLFISDELDVEGGCSHHR